jgi:sugar phosphate isomerase/epimerase
VTAPARAALEDLDANLGAFARIFRRASAAELAEAFEASELRQVQLNLSALGYPTIPASRDGEAIDFSAMRRAFEARRRVLWGLSATYNAADPDEGRRAVQSARAAEFIASSGDLGAVAATLCTGSRNAEDMWARHPDNGGEEAWSAMRRSLDVLLPAAEKAGVLLGIEPEPGNVVSGTAAARRLIGELGAEAHRVGVIIDPANLVADSARAQHRRVLEEAFDLLAERVVCVHAKDTVPWAQTLAGDGVVDYDLVLRLRSRLPSSVPVIIQDAAEGELPAIRDRLRATAIGVLER